MPPTGPVTIAPSISRRITVGGVRHRRLSMGRVVAEPGDHATASPEPDGCPVDRAGRRGEHRLRHVPPAARTRRRGWRPAACRRRPEHLHACGTAPGLSPPPGRHHGQSLGSFHRGRRRARRCSRCGVVERSTASVGGRGTEALSQLRFRIRLRATLWAQPRWVSTGADTERRSPSLSATAWSSLALGSIESGTARAWMDEVPHARARFIEPEAARRSGGSWRPARAAAVSVVRGVREARARRVGPATITAGEALREPAHSVARAPDQPATGAARARAPRGRGRRPRRTRRRPRRTAAPGRGRAGGWSSHSSSARARKPGVVRPYPRSPA